MPKSTYTMREDADRSWSVVIEDTGAPLRLAGIPQTGLSRIEAEIMLELLAPRATRRGEGVALDPAPLAKRAAA